MMELPLRFSIALNMEQLLLNRLCNRVANCCVAFFAALVPSRKLPAHSFAVWRAGRNQAGEHSFQDGGRGSEVGGRKSGNKTEIWKAEN
jgi:hypothetical protein